ncbi:hypothetical protein AADEFJLK_02598 [Methylovulum psychrotolerans]|uniref:Uncharacterized protein n=1 Tax=Methylovulum psychrotolerans TaxID=1704499 RepID=A0A2S5CLR9_9GAMM|nr:hypothetical protein AADEFJLK_02598 [Methylovulum psychrotolerans]
MAKDHCTPLGQSLCGLMRNGIYSNPPSAPPSGIGKRLNRPPLTGRFAKAQKKAAAKTCRCRKQLFKFNHFFAVARKMANTGGEVGTRFRLLNRRPGWGQMDFQFAVTGFAFRMFL